MPRYVPATLTTIEDLITKARTCLTCGKVHEWRRYGPPPEGGTFTDPNDGHHYHPTSMISAKWLESLLPEKTEEKSDER